MQKNWGRRGKNNDKETVFNILQTLVNSSIKKT